MIRFPTGILRLLFAGLAGYAAVIVLSMVEMALR